MNVDKATEIINQIASKLGVAAEYIAPELARMQIAQYAMATALSVVFFSDFGHRDKTRAR